MPSRDDTIYYGWYVVAAAFVANFVCVGITFYLMNAFMEPLTEVNGWTRTEVNLALVYGIFAHATSQLLWGTIVMRTGPRFLMLLGPLFAGVFFICLGCTDNLFLFYFYFILVNVGSGAFGGVVAGTAVNNWFIQKKGNAMGAASAGISMSGAMLPLAAMILIINLDLAGAFLWIGLGTMALGPVFWIVVRNWPEEYGLAPDGVVPEYALGDHAAKNTPAANPPGILRRFAPMPAGSMWNLGQIVKNGTFWKVGISFSFILIAVSSVMSQLKPRFSDLGFEDMSAMLMMSATALIGAAGKYVWGMLCDRYDSRRVTATLMSFLVLGLMLALLPVHPVSMGLFIIVFGFSMGGVMSTFPIIVADLFGRESFPAVFRVISLFFIVELAGFVIAGQSYDRTGSYNLAYLIYIVLGAAAVCLMLTVKRPVYPGNS
ncbi:MAG: hypothetical protein AVO39_04740 [delta proteobacterium MLS_D]|jgi:MFS transporter, OFA family, oxalate/formate antiporter|nr:MAG: hypothetical protein AVO39_04740 [delta proteobacterium MLS_D]